MSLSAIGTLLVVPPVNLLGLGALGAAALFWRPRLGRAMVVLAMAGLLLLAMPLVADALTVGLEQDLPLAPDPARPPQAIVVLGADVARRAGGGFDVGPLSLERVRAGAELARRTGLPVLITGGLTVEDGVSVGQAMADCMQADFGVPARWVERNSIDTWQNAAMSAPVLAADGIASVYVVTHAWHMRRALVAFEPTGLATVAAPAGLDAGPRRELAALAPSASALHRSYYALHEWIGLLDYRLTAELRRRPD